MKTLICLVVWSFLLSGPAAGAGAEAGREIERLRREIARHDALYHREARPEISDAAYDALRRRLTALEQAHPAAAAAAPPLPAFGDDRSGRGPSRPHREPMLSLDKVQRDAELRSFAARVARMAGQEEVALVVEPKYDGLAVSLTYEAGRLVRALTRGDGREGEDVTANVTRIKGVPGILAGEERPAVIELRGEVYVPWADFARVNAARALVGEPPFAHPRQLAAGTLRQADGAAVAERGLRLVCFGVGACEPRGALPATQRDLARRFREWGLPAIEASWPARGAEELVRAVAACGRARSVLPFAIDGAVVKVDARALQEELGAGEAAPRWAVAFKFAPERVETRLLAITLQVGRSGVLTPVAELAPVRLGGTTVARATLHHREEIARRDLRVGDTVYLEKAGDVIPAIVGVNLARRLAEAVPFEFPTECPACREPVEADEGGVQVRCANAACPALVRRRLEHFASKACVGIEGLGPTVVERLVASGLVRDLPDLYRVRRHHLLALGRMSEKTADRLVAAIERSKQAELWRVIHGLGLPQVGAVAARKLAHQHGSLAALGEADERCRDLVKALLAVGVEPRATEGEG
jgi:DNA ligase (NAD+)